MLTHSRAGRMTQPSAQRHAGSTWHMLRNRLLIVLLLLSVAIPAMSTAHTGRAAPPVRDERAPQGDVPKPTFAACPKGVPPHATCGTVAVLLDSTNPSLGTIPIAFELYRHTDTTHPALGTIVPSLGGPGISDTAADGLFLGLFGPILDRWNLLLIDHRGIGRSAVIDCPAVQHGLGSFAAAVRACWTKLGVAANLYGTNQAADDIDAVRAALGFDKIDYLGVSYGWHDVAAYAQRHPDHLRAAILETPKPIEDDTFSAALAPRAAQLAALVCRRSPSCAAANPDSAGTISWLAHELAAHPFDGLGYDANGTAHAVHVDEKAILQTLFYNYFSDTLIDQGELTAAAEALRAGDRTPLLRLVAESLPPTDAGPSAGFQSLGAALAYNCNDGQFVWDKRAPEATRQVQYNAALAGIGSATAPFSPAAWTAFVSQRQIPGPGADSCISWPAPTPGTLTYSPTTVFPHTQVLIMGGSLDFVPPSNIQRIRKYFPAGKVVMVANAGHFAGVWSPCAQRIDLQYIETLRIGDTNCASNPNEPFHAFGAPTTPAVPFRAVARFPRLAAEAIPAKVDSEGNDASTASDRKVASVAWSTVDDALVQAGRLRGSTGRGLRGGSFTVQATNVTTTITLSKARYSEDVAVSGTATFNPATNALNALVQVITSVRRRSGTLSFHGLLYTPTQPTIQVRGQMGHRTIALLTMAN